MFYFARNNIKAGPIRFTWEEAAKDAIAAGYADWSGYNDGRIYLADNANIKEVSMNHPNLWATGAAAICFGFIAWVLISGVLL